MHRPRRGGDIVVEGEEEMFCEMRGVTKRVPLYCPHFSKSCPLFAQRVNGQRDLLYYRPHSGQKFISLIAPLLGKITSILITSYKVLH